MYFLCGWFMYHLRASPEPVDSPKTFVLSPKPYSCAIAVRKYSDLARKISENTNMMIFWWFFRWCLRWFPYFHPIWWPSGTSDGSMLNAYFFWNVVLFRRWYYLLPQEELDNVLGCFDCLRDQKFHFRTSRTTKNKANRLKTQNVHFFLCAGQIPVISGSNSPNRLLSISRAAAMAR